jgi:hypothetical protein
MLAILLILAPQQTKAKISALAGRLRRISMIPCFGSLFRMNSIE